VTIENYLMQILSLKKKMTVLDLMQSNRLKRNPAISLLRDYSLYHACELFSRKPHLHRIPIVSNDGQLVNLITQSQMVTYFHSQKNKLEVRLTKK